MSKTRKKSYPKNPHTLRGGVAGVLCGGRGFLVNDMDDDMINKLAASYALWITFVVTLTLVNGYLIGLLVWHLVS